MELLELAKKEYAELYEEKKRLTKEMDELEKKMKPIIMFLRSSGELKTISGKKRGRKPKNAAVAE
jgi:cell division septum initiation protein DivIVA